MIVPTCGSAHRDSERQIAGSKHQSSNGKGWGGDRRAWLQRETVSPLSPPPAPRLSCQGFYGCDAPGSGLAEPRWQELTHV